MADKTYSFDLGGMNPDAQRSAAEAAGKVLHMEEKAGQTVAQELLPALDLITEALHIAQQAGNVQGFGELNTGEKAMAHYREQAPDMVAHLTALQEDCQAKIDHVLAMEVLYNNMDAYKGRVFDHTSCRSNTSEDLPSHRAHVGGGTHRRWLWRQYRVWGRDYCHKYCARRTRYCHKFLTYCH